MCKYCEQLEPYTEIDYDAFEDTSVHQFLDTAQLVQHENGAWTLSIGYKTWDEEAVPVTHCPWCGREL